MAYVVARPGPTYEIRESISTPRGPRSRTLATFRALSPDVLARAARRASVPFDVQRVWADAVAAGVPVAPPRADSAARTLLSEAASGRLPAPGLLRRLADALESGHAEGIDEWLDATPRERADALHDLLELSDRLPARERRRRRFPPLRPRAA